MLSQKSEGGDDHEEAGEAMHVHLALKANLMITMVVRDCSGGTTHMVIQSLCHSWAPKMTMIASQPWVSFVLPASPILSLTDAENDTSI